MKKSTTSKKRVFEEKPKKISKLAAKKWNPKSWEEVEAKGVIPDFKTPKSTAASKYPSPNSDEIFVLRWNDFIKDVSERDNFKPGHLAQLAILCELYVELHRLQSIINDHGYTYVCVGRNGTQLKTRPEVILLNRCRSEIRSYSKMLGLLLYKDKDFTDPTEKDGEDSWD